MWVIISIEHNQSGKACVNAATFSKIRNRAGRSAPTQNHRILFDVAREPNIKSARPAAKNFAIPRAFDVQDELAGQPRPSLPLPRGLGLGCSVPSAGLCPLEGLRSLTLAGRVRRLLPYFLPGDARILRTLLEFGRRLQFAHPGTFGLHRSDFSLPENDCHPRERRGRRSD